MSIARDGWSSANPELQSKLIAHRNKLLGIWAAEHMGMMGETAVEYALDLVGASASKNRNDAALVKKVCNDIQARGYPIAEGDVSRQLATCEAKARADILHDHKS